MHIQSQNSIPFIYSNIVEGGVKHHKLYTYHPYTSFTPFEMTILLFYSEGCLFTRDFFVLARVMEWNNLDTVSKFIKKTIHSQISIPRNYPHGPRKLNIMLTHFTHKQIGRCVELKWKL